MPGTTTGTYDHASELTSATLSGSTTNYSYNADGERLNATQSGGTVASGNWNGARQFTISPYANRIHVVYKVLHSLDEGGLVAFSKDYIPTDHSPVFDQKLRTGYAICKNRNNSCKYP